MRTDLKGLHTKHAGAMSGQKGGGGRARQRMASTVLSVEVGYDDLKFSIVHDLTRKCKLNRKRPRSNGTSRAKSTGKRGDTSYFLAY